MLSDKELKISICGCLIISFVVESKRALLYFTVFLQFQTNLGKIRNLYCQSIISPFSSVGWKVRCAEYFHYSTYFEGSRSSAKSNTAYNQICKNSENGSANHSEGGETADSLTLNGRLEAFKDLNI